ncbi:MAG: phosphoenolpyruvate carboxykinase (ATP) [Planctomycetota bacterium]
MSDELFDEGAYRRFASDLEDAVKSPSVQKVKLEDLRRPAFASARKTKFGSHGWRSFTSSRIGPKTVYLGSESVRLPSPSELHKQIIGNAPAQLEKVIHLLKTLPFVHLRRQMGDNPDFNPKCNLYMSVACKKGYRNGLMWGNTMRTPDKRPGPEFHLIHIPEEHNVRQSVMAIPEHNINVVLGSDYMGEDKKGFLRQAMWYADEHDMLGLHAGTKIVRARDTRTGKLKTYGVFLFGLSATGKSTWSCHHLGLDPKQDEETLVCQDDIVFLKRDGSAYGSENGFFVKTDVEEHLQEAMYNALTDKTALYENVMIDHEGNPDFLDESLCGNGRAVVQKSKLRRKIGWKMSRMDSPTINLPPLDELDGLMFAFITRRNTIMPFSLELTPEQAVLAYLWGESSHSFASQPAKAGESTRVVGTDPFIIGSRAAKVNRFRDIIYDLVARYPGKVRFFQYNTGGVGEIIETSMVDGKKKKNMIRKVARVPIDTMAAIQRGDVRMTNTYAEGRLGTKEVVSVEGCDLSAYDPAKLYTKDQVDFYLKDLVDGRRKFTAEIAAEGLDADIIQSAEESYSISRSDRTQVSVPAGEKVEEERPARTERAPVRDYFADYAPIRRPRRPSSRRSR